MNLRLLGAPTIADIVPEMVDAHSLHSHSSPPNDELYHANCGWPPFCMNIPVDRLTLSV